MAHKQHKAKVTIKPGASIALNARRIVAAQTEAFFARERFVGDVEAVTELHEMRIAAKRLRYAMELFASALGSDVQWCIDAVKEFQEIVGEIHDADVRVAMLDAYLHERMMAETGRLVAIAREDHDDDAIEGRKAQVRAAVTADEWVTEQVALAAAIARTAARRREQFAHLQERWMAWRAENLRARLEALRAPAAPKDAEREDATPQPMPPMPAPLVEQLSAS